jgi:hypothetical protein
VQTPVVDVPASLLIDANISVSAKLVWMLHAARGVVRCRSVCPRTESGLAEPTVRRAHRALVGAGWLSDRYEPLQGPPGARGAVLGRATALVPVTLLLDRRLGAQARVLYGVLRTLPSFLPRREAGHFTYAALHHLTGAGVNTLKAAVSQLSAAGWLGITQMRRRDPLQFQLSNPVATRGRVLARQARSRVHIAEYKGEAIMKEYLTLLIDSAQYEDNPRSGLLMNPMTGHLMEFDRYYRQKVAFEFNGPHHDGATKDVSEVESGNQQARDLMKKAICYELGIALFIVWRSDLTYAAMQRVAACSGLPLRDQIGLEPVAEELAYLARKHCGV